jgi:hypothetical protein
MEIPPATFEVGSSLGEEVTINHYNIMPYSLKSTNARPGLLKPS